MSPRARSSTIVLFVTAVLAAMPAIAAELKPVQAAPSAAPVQPPPQRVAPGHILVKLADGASEKQFFASAKPLGLKARSRVHGSKWMTVRVPPGSDPAVMARKARALPGVLAATVDPVIRIFDHFVPNDPMYVLPPTEYCDPLFEICVDANQWGLFDVGAEGAWHITLGSPDVVIAVLDSGVDLDHDDLYANIWTNPGEIPGNGVDDDGNGIVDDVHGADFAGDNVGSADDDPASFDGNPDVPMGGEWVPDGTAYLGERFMGDAAVGDGDDNNSDLIPDLGVFHGTAVAGVAAAMTDNLVPGSSTEYEGMAGACGYCRIMAVRMVNAEGEALESDAVEAIYYAVDQGATIINASWGLDIEGLSPTSPELIPLIEAIDHAIANGVTVVAATGNKGTPGVHYPAADPRVIAVGSSGLTQQVSAFSSTAFANEIPDNGFDDDGNGWIDDVVDVVAPGEAIWTAWVFAAYDSWVFEYLFLDPNWPPGIDTYSASDGTSFATPLVAGYLGLVKSQFPSATTEQLRAVLRGNADASIGLPGYDAESGFGRLQMIIPASLPGGNAMPTAQIAGAGNGTMAIADTGLPGSEFVTLDASGSSDPDGSVVSYAWSWRGTNNHYGVGTGPSVTLRLMAGATYEVTLVVTDDGGMPSPPLVVTVKLVSTWTTPPGGKTGGPAPWYRPRLRTRAWYR